jgi:hypothetical protein
MHTLHLKMMCVHLVQHVQRVVLPMLPAEQSSNALRKFMWIVTLSLQHSLSRFGCSLSVGNATVVAAATSTCITGVVHGVATTTAAAHTLVANVLLH